MGSRDEISLSKALSSDGYNQTYIIQSSSIPSESNKGNHAISNNREVFFRCGNWCYKGKVQFNDIDISVKNTTLLISTLQKQQTSLRFDCNSSELPTSSVYFEPLAFFNDAVEFISSEISSEKTNAELRRMSNIFPWIDADDDDGNLEDTLEDGNNDSNNRLRAGSKSYFELMLTHVPVYMNSIRIIASKTYSRGLILISIYYEGSIYFVVLSGEGDQGLLDVRFPDVCSHGQGLLIAFYGSDTALSTRKNDGGDDDDDDRHGDKNNSNHNSHRSINSINNTANTASDIDDKKDSNYDEKLNAAVTTLHINNNNNNRTSNKAESKSSSSLSTSPRICSKYTLYYQKLTLWQSFGSSNMMMDFNELMAAHHQQPVKVDTMNLTTHGYQQTYIILKEPDRSNYDNNSNHISGNHSEGDDYHNSMDDGYYRNGKNSISSSSSAAYRDVLFRFGSWCYTGRIRLVESELELQDIPIMIPVLRAQQSALEFAYEASEVPLNSPYAAPMEYIHRVITPAVMTMMSHSEAALQSLIDRLSQVGLEASVKSWLEGNSGGGSDGDDGSGDSSFFEFSLSTTHPSLECLMDIEAVASKCYLPNGVCAIMIIHQSTVYVSLQSMGSGDNQPLLDSRFPDVASKGRGYILQTSPNGTSEWPALRKMSVWQSAAALQKEFYTRTSLQAQAKVKPTTPSITTTTTTSSTATSVVSNRVRDSPTRVMPVTTKSGSSSSSSDDGTSSNRSGVDAGGNDSKSSKDVPPSSSADDDDDDDGNGNGNDSKAQRNDSNGSTAVSSSSSAKNPTASSAVAAVAESKSSPVVSSPSSPSSKATTVSTSTTTVTTTTAAAATPAAEVTSRFVLSGTRTVDELYEFLISLSSNPKAITGNTNNNDNVDHPADDDHTNAKAIANIEDKISPPHGDANSNNNSNNNNTTKPAVDDGQLDDHVYDNDSLGPTLPTANISTKNNNHTFLRGAMPHHLPPLAAALVKSPDLQQSLKMGGGSMSAWDPLTGAPLGHAGSHHGSKNNKK